MRRHKPTTVTPIGTHVPYEAWMVPGARVRNRGDVMNSPKNGAIARTFADNWYNHIEITWEDGTSSTVTTNSFAPGPLGSTARFVRLHSYELRPDAQVKLEAMAEKYGIHVEDALCRAIALAE